MSVLDLFSAAPGIRAANKSASALTSGANKGFNYATGQLNTGAGNATDALRTGYNNGISTLQDWYNQGRGDLSLYSQQAIDALRGGTAQQVGAYQQGIAPWETIASQSSGFLPLFAGATGAGGDPNAANDAFQQFWNSTGSQSALDRGLEGISRTGQSTGQLGAANQDAIKYSQDLNQQQYGSWLNNLFQGVGVNEDAARGIQSGQNLIGGAYGDQGKGIAELLGQTGSSLLNADIGAGTNIGNAQIGLGNQTAGIDTGLASALATLGNNYYNQQGKTTADKYAQQFGARNAADSNTLSALFGIANLGVNAFTGGLGSGFGNLFGQGAVGAGGDPMSDYSNFSYTNGIPTYEY